MFNIDASQNIVLNKGDSAAIYVQVVDLDGKEYEIKSTDVITLTVKQTEASQTASITKTADSQHYIVLNPADTSSLSAGLYVYSVELVTAEGQHYTIVPLNFFRLISDIGPV